jgi:hypothetical protein
MDDWRCPSEPAYYELCSPLPLNRVGTIRPEMSGARAAGVCWDDHNKAWRAAIVTDAGGGEGKERFLGSFVNEVDAALAYDQAAREHRKDKAELNFPEGPPALPPAAFSEAPRPQASSQYRGESMHTWGLRAPSGYERLATFT